MVFCLLLPQHWSIEQWQNLHFEAFWIKWRPILKKLMSLSGYGVVLLCCAFTLGATTSLSFFFNIISKRHQSIKVILTVGGEEMGAGVGRYLQRGWQISIMLRSWNCTRLRGESSAISQMRHTPGFELLLRDASHPSLMHIPLSIIMTFSRFISWRITGCTHSGGEVLERFWTRMEM